MTGPCDDCDLSGPEAHRQLAESVCVIQGPGRLECWGCPVRDCVAWQNPMNPLSPETQAVALRAAHKLETRETVVSGGTDATAYDLAVAVGDPVVQKGLLVQMAAEAVLNDLVRDAVVKRRNQYTDRWMKGLKGRSPTQDDDADLDYLLLRAEADAGADAYGCDPEAVLQQLAWFRGRRIVKRGLTND